MGHQTAPKHFCSNDWAAYRELLFRLALATLRKRALYVHVKTVLCIFSQPTSNSIDMSYLPPFFLP